VPGLRDAATTLLVRDGVTSLEVFMLRRSADAAFAPGAYVFPGGTLTEEDRAPDLESVCAGRTDREASAALGVPSGGLAFWIAAIRECFEEAGVLLARDPGGGRSIEFTDTEVERRFIHHRHALQAGRRRFLDIVCEERLLLDTGNVHYFSHWITPEGLERRYDTRFFVAAAPPGQQPRHDAQETVAGLWIRPTEALERYHRGTFDLVIATLKHLEVMTRYDRAADLLDAARAVTSVPTILPRIARQGDRARSLLPGEPGYDEAT
jgi:8-oxo-dGTP pyrophosphatase MutT (NUDIX family)